MPAAEPSSQTEPPFLVRGGRLCLSAQGWRAGPEAGAGLQVRPGCVAVVTLGGRSPGRPNQELREWSGVVTVQDHTPSSMFQSLRQQLIRLAVSPSSAWCWKEKREGPLGRTVTS
ncbi:hypothetical protein H1C71_008249 [Ictidomys tridecemlineatus]|nr:hypothetical protein H1C71_008249 [Ictidomys tridecemlineatus]